MIEMKKCYILTVAKKHSNVSERLVNYIVDSKKSEEGRFLKDIAKKEFEELNLGDDYILVDFAYYGPVKIIK